MQEPVLVYWRTPAGRMMGQVDEAGWHVLTFCEGTVPSQTAVRCEADRSPHPTIQRHIDGMTRFLTGYFRKEFSCPLPVVAWQPRTPFERAVWQQMVKVPAGEATTYGALAEAVGRPGGARAVGQAMRRNPLVLINPCHRVLACGRKLGGYSGGLSCKRFLLSHENINIF